MLHKHFLHSGWSPCPPSCVSWCHLETRVRCVSYLSSEDFLAAVSYSADEGGEEE